jgi:hypothetical protein
MTRQTYLTGCAAGVLFVIAMGAVVTSGHAELEPAHRLVAILVSFLLVGLIRLGPRGWFALAIAALEYVPASPVFHACLAPVLLAAIVFNTAESPRVESPPSLTWMAIAIPPLVLVQIALGAAYRHKIWGVLPHMGGAMIVALLALILCMLLLRERPTLRTAVITTMTIVLCQVALGITSFMLRLLDLDSGPWFTVLTTAHVSVGAATLAATALLGRLVVGDPPPHRENAEP